MAWNTQALMAEGEPAVVVVVAAADVMAVGGIRTASVEKKRPLLAASTVAGKIGNLRFVGQHDTSGAMRYGRTLVEGKPEVGSSRWSNPN